MCMNRIWLIFDYIYKDREVDFVHVLITPKNRDKTMARSYLIREIIFAKYEIQNYAKTPK